MNELERSSQTNENSKTPSELFEERYGYSRVGNPVRFQEEGRELQAEAFEVLIKPGNNSAHDKEDRGRIGQMVLDARAAGYRFVGSCTVPGIEARGDKLTGVQVFLERPAPPTSMSTPSTKG